MKVPKRLNPFIRRNVQVLAAIRTIGVAVLLADVVTIYYGWLHSWVVLIIFWLVGVFTVYVTSVVMGFSKKKYRFDDGKLAAFYAAEIQKSGIRLRHIIVKKSSVASARAIGFGNRRAIVLSSALCEELPSNQLKAVMGHELGHHVHHDPLAGIVIGMTAADAVAWAGVSLAGALDGGLLVILVISTLLAIVILVPATAYSRHIEARADTYSGKLTGKPKDMSLAMASILANFVDKQGWTMNQDVPLWVRAFGTHPPFHERIERH